MSHNIDIIFICFSFDLFKTEDIAKMSVCLLLFLSQKVQNQLSVPQCTLMFILLIILFSFSFIGGEHVYI